MLFQTCKTSVHLQNTNEDIFDIFERFLSQHFDASKSSSRDHKTNPYELSGLVQIF